MLEEIGEDKLSRTLATNQPMFRTDIDYEAAVATRAAALQRWSQLDACQRREYRDQADFEAKNSVPDLKDQSLIPAKNVQLLLKEIRKRVDQDDPLSLLGIEPLDFEDAAIELAETLENVSEIRELYKLRKAATGTTKNAGITSDEASKLKNCFTG